MMENVSLILEALGAYFTCIMFYIITPCVFFASLVWLVKEDWK